MLGSQKVQVAVWISRTKIVGRSGIVSLRGQVGVWGSDLIGRRNRGLLKGKLAVVAVGITRAVDIGSARALSKAYDRFYWTSSKLVGLAVGVTWAVDIRSTRTLRRSVDRCNWLSS